MIGRPKACGATKVSRIGIATPAPTPRISMVAVKMPIFQSPQGRSRQAPTSTRGYSQTLSKITGARKALKPPPTTPPNDIQK